MPNIKKDNLGINRPIICKRCGYKIGHLRIKPALMSILEKSNRKETWFYIFAIALTTQIISDLIINILKWFI